jgi:hypothetical protein
MFWLKLRLLYISTEGVQITSAVDLLSREMSMKGADCLRALVLATLVRRISAYGVDNWDYSTNQHLIWASSDPDGTPTGRSGKVDFELTWGGPNGRDENGSGGVTRRVVLAWEKDSCMERCQEPDLSNQACVTSNERGQLAGVPIKDNFVLYILGDGDDAQNNNCNSNSRPRQNDFIERAGAAAALQMFPEDLLEHNGRPWNGAFPRPSDNHSDWWDKLAPEKTLAYHRLTNPNGPEPRFINKLTVPYGVIFSGKTATHGVAEVGGLAMRLEIEAGLAVEVFWSGTGAIVPEEREALREFYSQAHLGITFVDLQGWGGNGGGGISIAEFLADDTLDPCLNRVADTMCINGHIVSFTHAWWWIEYVPCNVFELFAKFPKLAKIVPAIGTDSFALTCSHNETALVPCSFWKLADMTYMQWNFDTRGPGTDIYNPTLHFEECSDEVGMMPNLVYASFIATGATGKLPARFFQSPKVTSLSIDGIQLGGFPPINMPDLKTLALINTNITGPMRSFANSAALQEIRIEGNLLQNAEGATASCFDNCPELTSAIITDTEITKFFNFVGSTKLVFLDLSHNEIDVLIPDSWSRLVETETVDLSHNSIRRINPDVANIFYDWLEIGTYPKRSPLKYMTKLASLDLSHNEISDDLSGMYTMIYWFENIFTTDATDSSIGPKHLDLSHNKLYSEERPTSPERINGPPVSGVPSRNQMAIIGLGRRKPVHSMATFSFHHNRLAGILSIEFQETCRINFDGSYNRISGIAFGDTPEGQGMWCYRKHAALMRMDMSNQVSTLPRFISGSRGSFLAVAQPDITSLDYTLGLAGESILMGSDFVPPAAASFRKVEYPKASGTYPFSCTQWVLRGNPSGVVNIDPEFYEYTGGSTPELRMKWFDPALDSYRNYETTFGGSDGFCKCDLPYSGTPPNCVYLCGVSNFAKSPGLCEQCSLGVDCSSNRQELQTLQLQPNYWRISSNSTGVYRCITDGACVGGQIAGMHGAGYCAENHEAVYLIAIYLRCAKPFS